MMEVEWIPCSVRQPPKWSQVIAWCDGNVGEAHFNGRAWNWAANSDGSGEQAFEASHWMPFPAGPEE